jgi:muramidase (phage lysozyme)
MTPNVKAFLQVIAESEIGKALLSTTDNGYNVLVGSVPGSPNLFTDYADHPRRRIWLERLKVSSTAAGRYQILARTFDDYKVLLNLPDFSPASQDSIAVQMIRELDALPLLEQGDFAGAVHRCSNLWASLPGAGYQQHENKLADLRTAYTAAGGTITEDA